MGIKTTKYETSDYLDSPQAVEAYLEAAFETNDTALVAAALGDVVKARGMKKVADKAGLSRESLYRALSETGNPELGTILKVLNAVGVTLTPKLHARS